MAVRCAAQSGEKRSNLEVPRAPTRFENQQTGAGRLARGNPFTSANREEDPPPPPPPPPPPSPCPSRKGVKLWVALIRFLSPCNIPLPAHCPLVRKAFKGPPSPGLGELGESNFPLTSDKTKKGSRSHLNNQLRRLDSISSTRTPTSRSPSEAAISGRGGETLSPFPIESGSLRIALSAITVFLSHNTLI